MPLFRKIIPIVFSTGLLLIFETLLYQPPHFLYLWLGGLLMIAIALLGLSRKDYWKQMLIFFVTQLAFYSGLFFFIFFISGDWIRQFIIALGFVLNIIHLTNIYHYNFRPEKYQVNALQNISSYLNLIAFFCLSSVGFGVIFFLSWPTWLVTLGLGLITGLLSLLTMWMNKVVLADCYWSALIYFLIGLEVFWAVSFLPSSFLVNGLLLTLVYYLMVNLGRYYYLAQLQKPIILRYLIISLTVLILTLVTARWT